MDFELSGKLQKLLQENKIAACIEIAEDELIQQPKNNFRKIIGRKDLLKQAKKLNKLIGKFNKSANKKIYVKSICAELTKISLNTDNWDIELYAYDNYGGSENYKWLEEWQHENKDRDNFTLKGFEDLQKAFKKYKEADETEKEAKSISANLCETLVILRLFELFEATYKLALEDDKKWTKNPLIVKADGNELIYEIKNSKL